MAESSGAPMGAENSTASDVEVVQPQAEVATPQADRKSQFKELIGGEWKAEADEYISDTVKKRLKSSKETVDKYNALTPTLELLASKYGVDATDIDALNQAIEDDDSYYEQEALDRDMTVEQLKEWKKMEKENAALKQKENDRQAQAIVDEWHKGEEYTKQFYPNFSLEEEHQNPNFERLLRSGVDVKGAYEAAHINEIMVNGMKVVADRTSEQVANSVIANGLRPSENGLNGSSSANTRIDPSKMSAAQLDELYQRAQNGERITLT